MNNMNKMLNDGQLYPTPKSLIEKMLLGLKCHRFKTILEPSAGMGNIVDFYVEKHKYDNKKDFSIDCIEIDANLRHILKGNGHKVIHDDFLTFSTYKMYDLILMNPPFADGDKHLLKALELQANGGEIVCVLNAETIKNPFSNTRKELVKKLNNLNANIEFLQDEFIISERTTNVEIALIKICVPKNEQRDKSYIFDSLFKAKKESEEFNQKNDIIKSDFLENLIEQYQIEIEGTLRLIREYEAIKPYMLRGIESTRTNTSSYDTSTSILSLVVGSTHHDYREANVNDYLPIVRKKYWKFLLTNDEFTGMMTSNLQEDYKTLTEKMVDYDFTMFNINAIKQEMLCNLQKGIEDTILKLFDELTYTYSYCPESQHNVYLYNGWKTNTACKVNSKKVIMPYTANMKKLCSDYNLKTYDFYFQGRGIDKLKDMEKILNYLDDGLTENIDIEEALFEASKNKRTSKIKLKYFTVTFYKKGTCHINWDCPNLIDKLNIFVSQRRSWLPPNYGKKQYAEMDNEEKLVINNFQGEEAYQVVMSNKNYYLFQSSNNLFLDY